MGGERMPRKEVCSTKRIGNTVFYVTSIFSGKVELQHVIKQPIQKGIEKKYC